MTTKNLWGELPALASSRSPKEILQEQASLLTTATKGILRGKLEVTREGDYLVFELSIQAPFLQSYEVGIVMVHHKPLMYPLSLRNIVGSHVWVDCNTEEEFVAKLEGILQ